MRILHVISNLAAQSGGPAKATVEMAAAVAACGHDVAVFASDFGGDPVDLAPARQAGVEIEIFPAGWPRFWQVSRPLGEALATAIPKSDVVHLNSLYLYHDWVTGKLCRLTGVPYILRPHGTLDPYIRQQSRLKKALAQLLFQRRVLQGAARIHYTAKDEETLAQGHVEGRPGVVIPLGLNLSDYRTLPDPVQFRAAFPDCGERPIILFLSRLHEKKGLDLLLPAFAAARAAGHDLQLVIAGPDDGMVPAVKTWIRDLGLQQRVTLTGMLRGEAKLAAFAAASLFALPSYSENFGLAVIEALACGLPVLISDKVNIWPEIEAAGAGRIVPCEQAAVTAALTSLFSQPANLQALAQAAKPAAELYDWPAIAVRLEKLYSDVIAQTQGGPEL